MRPGRPISGVCEVPTSRSRSSVIARSRTGDHVGRRTATAPTRIGRASTAARTPTNHPVGAGPGAAGGASVSSTGAVATTTTVISRAASGWRGPRARRATGGPIPRRGRRGERGTTRRTRSTIAAFERDAAHPSSSAARVVSNHSDSPYSSQWYGAKGVKPRGRERLHRRAAPAPTGSDRTREPVAACSTSASSVSRIVPNSAAPMLYAPGPGRSRARRQASARSSAWTNWYRLRAPVEHVHRRPLGDELEQDRR